MARAVDAVVALEKLQEERELPSRTPLTIGNLKNDRTIKEQWEYATARQQRTVQLGMETMRTQFRKKFSTNRESQLTAFNEVQSQLLARRESLFGETEKMIDYLQSKLDACHEGQMLEQSLEASAQRRKLSPENIPGKVRDKICKKVRDEYIKKTDRIKDELITYRIQLERQKAASGYIEQDLAVVNQRIAELNGESTFIAAMKIAVVANVQIQERMWEAYVEPYLHDAVPPTDVAYGDLGLMSMEIQRRAKAASEVAKKSTPTQ